MPVALVTGASRGFGRALDPRPRRTRLALVVDARGRDLLAAAAPGSPAPAGVIAVAGDVTDPGHRAELVAAAAGSAASTCWCNNAACSARARCRRCATTRSTPCARVLRGRRVAPLALAQALLPALRPPAARSSTLSSDAAVEAYPGWGGYGAPRPPSTSSGGRARRRGARAARLRRSTRATCGPRCTSGRSPARTSATGRSPETVVPALLRLLDRAPAERPLPRRPTSLAGASAPRPAVTAAAAGATRCSRRAGLSRRDRAAGGARTAPRRGPAAGRRRRPARRHRRASATCRRPAAPRRPGGA